MTAMSRKGLWHFARTMAAQTGMAHKWFAEQGLKSVKEQWVQFTTRLRPGNLYEPLYAKLSWVGPNHNIIFFLFFL